MTAPYRRLSRKRYSDANVDTTDVKGDFFATTFADGAPADLQIKHFRLELTASRSSKIGASEEEKEFYREINEFLADHTIYDIEVNQDTAMAGDNNYHRRRWLVKDVHVYYKGDQE